jgi:hypothetical protein
MHQPDANPSEAIVPHAHLATPSVPSARNKPRERHFLQVAAGRAAALIGLTLLARVSPAYTISGGIGNFYLSVDTGRTWSRRGNVFGTSTPALQETWGALKARYHSPAPTRSRAEQR